MELRDLRYFVAVAEELHFTRAAARLQTAQSVLSRQIRRLERELGVELFTRTKRSVRLTDTGRVLLEHARRVIDEADGVRRAAQQAAQGRLGRLAVGFVPQAAAELLPDLVIPYRTEHPRVDIELRELPTLKQVDALIAGEIDVGLLTQRVDEPRLRTLQLRRQRLVVAMPATHRLASRRSVRLRELANEPWINPLAHSSFLFAACAKAGFEPKIAQQVAEEESRLAFVATGIGLALLAESGPRLPGRHIVYLPLDQPGDTRKFAAAWPKDPPSPLVNGFLDIARSTLRPAAARP